MMQPQIQQPPLQPLPPQPHPQRDPDLLEVAIEVLDLAEAVLDLEPHRTNSTWVSMESGNTPTSPLSNVAFDNDEVLI